MMRHWPCAPSQRIRCRTRWCARSIVHERQYLEEDSESDPSTDAQTNATVTFDQSRRAAPEREAHTARATTNGALGKTRACSEKPSTLRCRGPASLRRAEQISIVT